VEENSEGKLGRIIIDNRAQMNRKSHNEQECKTKGVFIDILS